MYFGILRNISGVPLSIHWYEHRSLEKATSNLFYLEERSCTSVDCPANSEGANVPAGCSCEAGFSGSIEVPAVSYIFFSCCGGWKIQIFHHQKSKLREFRTVGFRSIVFWGRRWSNGQVKKVFICFLVPFHPFSIF